MNEIEYDEYITSIEARDNRHAPEPQVEKDRGWINPHPLEPTHR